MKIHKGRYVKNNVVYLTVADVAKRLQVSNQTVWRWIKDGKLPAINISGQYRIAPDDLDKFLKEHYRQPHGD